jgi:hypothetical protein
VKKMLERQMLAIKNAMLISQQAQASAQFAESMEIMSQQIGAIFGDMDLTQTQAQWEKAVAQAGSMEERMELFLDSMEDAARSGDGGDDARGLVTDDEIDRMINAEVLASERRNSGSSTIWKARSRRSWAPRSRKIRAVRAPV